MNFKLERTFSGAGIFDVVDALKAQVDAMRPLAGDVEGRVMQKFRLEWNYHSNAIEGNKLSYGETVAFLMEGITAKGKPLKDHLDIRGHNEAINFLLSIVKDTRPINETDIRALHKMILVEPYRTDAQTADGLPTTKLVALGEYKTSPNHVQTSTGETHYYATPEETPAKMQELLAWYHAITTVAEVHPIVVASLFHHKFVAIHPFDDGNGRLSRILMNLILMQNGLLPVIVKTENRQNYYALLNRADADDHWPFVEYIAELAQSSLNLYLKAANGGDIDDEDDIEKEIALFRMEISGKVTANEARNSLIIQTLVNESLNPFFNRLYHKIRPFENDFKGFLQSIDVTFFDKVAHTSLTSINGIALDKLTNNLNYLKSVEVFMDFRKFKNPDNDFDLTANIYIEFDEFKYNVFGNQRTLILSKLYPGRLSKLDQDIIIKSVVNDIQRRILKHFRKQ